MNVSHRCSKVQEAGPAKHNNWAPAQPAPLFQVNLSTTGQLEKA